MVLFSCGNKQKTSEVVEKTSANKNQIVISTLQFESEKMELGSITKQDFNTVVNVNGMIDVPPENKFSVTTFIGGYVTKIPLLVGDKVKKGTLVASLKNTEFIEIQQHYLETTAQLSFLKNEYNRQKKLFDEKISSVTLIFVGVVDISIHDATKTISSVTISISKSHSNVPFIQISENRYPSFIGSEGFITLPPFNTS